MSGVLYRCFSLMILYWLTAEALFLNQHFEVKNNTCFSDEVEVVTESVSSVVWCAALCTSLQSCLSASYDGLRGKCNWSSKCHPETTSSNTGVVMTKSGYHHACEIVNGSTIESSTTEVPTNSIANIGGNSAGDTTNRNGADHISTERYVEINTTMMNFDTDTTEFDVYNIMKEHYSDQTTINLVLIANLPNDCSDLPTDSQSGVYTLDRYGTFMTVYCDVTSEDRWTILQRRIDGSTSFYRTWEEYKTGFGDMSSEFWLGNERIHTLTSNRNYVIRFDLEDFEGNTSYADYSVFRVGDEDSNYNLMISGYSGTAGDGMFQANGMMFSTKDSDNDIDVTRHCSRDLNRGGWWYRACTYVNLNGIYKGAGKKGHDSIMWRMWRDTFSLKSTMIKIKTN